MRLALLLRGTSKKGMISLGSRQSAPEEKYGGWSANPRGSRHRITVRTHAIAELKSADFETCRPGQRRKQALESSRSAFRPRIGQAGRRARRADGGRGS